MNTQTQEALKMAIETMEFIKDGGFYTGHDDCINACKEALEAEQVCQEDSRVRQNDVPAQEPVAYLSADKKAVITRIMRIRRTEDEMNGKVIKDFPIPLYTHPHQWQVLTEDEICKLADSSWEGISPHADTIAFARAIEAKLKEKNHGA